MSHPDKLPAEKRRALYQALRVLGMGSSSAQRIKDWTVPKIRLAIRNIHVWKY